MVDYDEVTKYIICNECNQLKQREINMLQLEKKPNKVGGLTTYQNYRNKWMGKQNLYLISKEKWNWHAIQVTSFGGNCKKNSWLQAKWDGMKHKSDVKWKS